MKSQTLRKKTSSYTDRALVNTLVLDDEAFDRRKIRYLVQRSKLPLNIVEATSLTALNDAISESRFDLFLLDYQLGEGDGLQAIDLIRRDPELQNAVLIMITGNEAQDLAVSALRRGCSDLISKHELSADLLKERVDAALKPKRMIQTNDLFEGEKLHRQLRDAMQNNTMRDEITEGFRRVVRQADFHRSQREREKFETFIRDFLQEDEFRFK